MDISFLKSYGYGTMNEQRQRYECIISRAIDLIAGNEEKKAETQLEKCIVQIKSDIKANRSKIEAYFAWGMCLSVMDEYQQALVKFEKVLEFFPDHEEALWQITQIMWYNLDKVSIAERILEDKLTVLYPFNSTYTNALAEVKAAIRLRH